LPFFTLPQNSLHAHAILFVVKGEKLARMSIDKFYSAIRLVLSGKKSSGVVEEKKESAEEVKSYSEQDILDRLS